MKNLIELSTVITIAFNIYFIIEIIKSKRELKAMKKKFRENLEYCFCCNEYVYVNRNDIKTNITEKQAGNNYVCLYPKRSFRCNICNTEQEIYQKLVGESPAAKQ